MNEDFVYVDDIGWVPNTKTELCEIIEAKAETIFLSVENLLENKEFMNNFFRCALVFCGVAILIVPKNAAAQTMLREKSKFVETTLLELVEPVKEIVQTTKDSLVKKPLVGVRHRLGGPKLPIQEKFREELVLKIFNDELLKPEVVKLLKPEVIKNSIKEYVSKPMVWEPIGISKPLVIAVSKIEENKPGLIVSLFSGSFALGMNLLFRNVFVFRILCVPMGWNWVPLPWGTRSVVKGFSVLKKLYLVNKSKTENTKSEDTNEKFLSEMLNLIEKPGQEKTKIKKSNPVSPLSKVIYSNGIIRLLIVMIGAFYLRLNKKEDFSKLLVKVGVVKSTKITSLEMLRKFVDPSKPSLYIAIGSTTCVIYVYLNREKLFFQSGSIFSLAFGFMEKQMNSSLKIMGDSSLFVQNLTLNSLKKLDAVSENKTEEIVVLKTKIDTLETEVKMLTEKHHEADKALFVTQSTLGNCRNTLSEIEFGLAEGNYVPNYSNQERTQDKIEGSGEPSTSRSFTEKAALKQALIERALTRFPDAILPKKGSSVAVAIIEKESFLKKLTRDLMMQDTWFLY